RHCQDCPGVADAVGLPVSGRSGRRAPRPADRHDIVRTAPALLMRLDGRVHAACCLQRVGAELGVTARSRLPIRLFHLFGVAWAWPRARAVKVHVESPAISADGTDAWRWLVEDVLHEG